MTITFLELYNKVAEQAWSMYDAEAESQEDFESGLKSSIQKALSELWCSYPFPFRIGDYKVTTQDGVGTYDMPTGNIYKKDVKGKKTYSVRLGTEYLTLTDDIETFDAVKGRPTQFQVYKDKLKFYPIPDGAYDIEIEYEKLEYGEDDFGDKVFKLEDEEDFIDVGDKYEELFKNALITKAMMYAIASKEDENYAGYKEQFDNAYKILREYSIGLDKDKRVVL